MGLVSLFYKTLYLYMTGIVSSGLCDMHVFFWQEPMYYGYLFALGLLSSTLVSAVLTTHFNYQVMSTRIVYIHVHVCTMLGTECVGELAQMVER